jgi:hypothetical protein
MILPGDLVVWDASHAAWDKHPMLVLSVFKEGPRRFGEIQKEWYMCQLLISSGAIIDKYHFLLKKIV